jgi:hypothetical protein
MRAQKAPLACCFSHVAGRMPRRRRPISIEWQLCISASFAFNCYIRTGIVFDWV